MPDYEYDASSNYAQPTPHSNNNHSRVPRAPLANQAPMRTDYSFASPGRSAPGRVQEQCYPQESAWDMSQNVYDGSGYEEDYGPNDYYRQWPLPGNPYEQPTPSNTSPRRTPERPQPPDDSNQRSDIREPIRDPPRSTTSMMKADRQYQHSHGPQLMSHHGNGQWIGDGYSYTPPSHPPPNRPPPQNPQLRQASSPIPQYPLPQMPLQAASIRTHNHRAPLGPPPSSRRGPPAYYPDVVPVHPIVEETDSMRSSFRNGSVRTGGHDSKTSFASSNAIPIGIPQTYLDNHTGARPGTAKHTLIPEDAYEISATGEDAIDEALAHFERVVPPSRDQESPEVMVRQASVGKKSRPTLTDVKGEIGFRKSRDSDQGIATLANQRRRGGSKDAQETEVGTECSRALGGDKLKDEAEPSGRDDERYRGRSSSPIMSDATIGLTRVGGSGARTPEEVLKSGTGFLDASDSSESEHELRRKNSRELLGSTVTEELHPQRSHTRSPLAPSDEERMISILQGLERGSAITTDDTKELKKPSGGLSEKSGKRRPPRLNVDAVRDAEARGSLTSLPDLIMRATKLASNLDRGKTASRMGMDWFDGTDDNEKRHSGSISDALNSFPLPCNATPPSSRGELRRSIMSGRLRHSTLPSDSDPGEVQNRTRRCCGMPLWLFILLMLLLLLLVAAAVVLPVVFVVLPKQNNNHDTSPVGSCERKLNCENGGANILNSNGYCECVCRNGYYGTTCSSVAAQGCTTTSIGMIHNATLGEAIPPLLEGAQSNFSVPLDGQELLSLFSGSNISCVSQNALVTFNEAGKRSGSIVDKVTPLTLLLARESTASTVTRDGIVYATDPPAPSPSLSIAMSNASYPGEDDASGINGSNTRLDFARIAVLYVLQASGDFQLAITAQENLQSYFRSNRTNSIDITNPVNITLGGTFHCDLHRYIIDVGNGTVVGGGPS